jgi:hypothetical protein
MIVFFRNLGLVKRYSVTLSFNGLSDFLTFNQLEEIKGMRGSLTVEKFLKDRKISLRTVEGHNSSVLGVIDRLPKTSKVL